MSQNSRELSSRGKSVHGLDRSHKCARAHCGAAKKEGLRQRIGRIGIAGDPAQVDVGASTNLASNVFSLL